jgi:hypothetical protein
MSERIEPQISTPAAAPVPRPGPFPRHQEHYSTQYTPHPASRYGSDVSLPWRIVVVVLLVIAAAVAAYFYYRPDALPVSPVLTAPEPAAAASAPPAPPAEPVIQFPIEQAKQEQKPPAALFLKDSNPAAQSALTSIFGANALSQFFRVDNFVRRFVATFDALPREKASQNLMPLKPVSGRFLTTRAGANTAAIAPENAARYTALVQLFARMDARKLVNAYANHYGLFQEAYRELGYPKGYFNDRLVACIDSLLATPDVPGPIALIQPKVQYEFARPELEALPAGQKAMLRIGPDNARIVKAKLREVRQALTGQELKP